MKKAIAFWPVFLALLCGIVVGGLLGELLGGVNGFQWLSYGFKFGIDTASPFILDLSIIKLAFGCTVKLNVASVIGIFISMLVYIKVMR